MSNKYLIIVESPSKIKKIEEYVGPNYQVVASCGHVRALASLKDIDIVHQYECNYTIPNSKKTLVGKLGQIISTYPKSNVLLGTDNDREGEAIAYHLCMLFQLPIESTKRILFNEITKHALLHAIEPSQQTILNMNVVKSQQARQILDILIGFKISPLLWKYVSSSKSSSLSAGRCQTPALRILFENHIQIQKERESPSYSYKIIGHFFPSPFTLKMDVIKQFPNENECRDFLEQTKTFPHTFQLGETTKSVRNPPKPFHTASLLQSASNVLRYSPKVTT